MSRITFGTSPGKRQDLIYRNPVFKAMGHKPMRQDKQVDLKLAAELSFESVQHGTGDASDRDNLVCIVNIAMVMAETHCNAEDLAMALAAQDALLRADGRVLQGKLWNLDGEGRQQIKAAMDMHDQQIAQLGQNAVIAALLEMQRRNYKGQVHRVELMR